MGGSDLEEFKVFIAGILRWLKMNCLLGETSIEMQVDYLGTRLTGEVQEWFYRNVEQFNRQVREWTLETVAQGLQRRFLHTLTHHHASNKFDTVSQGNKTVQEVLNDLKRYATWMIHPHNGMRCAENAHTAVSNTKPAAHKTLLLTVQLRTVVGRENVVHRTQPTCTYHALKPEQRLFRQKIAQQSRAIDRNLCRDCPKGKVIA